jgi:hypothetical protein
MSPLSIPDFFRQTQKEHSKNPYTIPEHVPFVYTTFLHTTTQKEHSKKLLMSQNNRHDGVGDGIVQYGAIDVCNKYLVLVSLVVSKNTRFPDRRMTSLRAGKRRTCRYIFVLKKQENLKNKKSVSSE